MIYVCMCVCMYVYHVNRSLVPKLQKNVHEIHTVLAHTSHVHSILLLTNITSTNKPHLFSLTQIGLF